MQTADRRSKDAAQCRSASANRSAQIHWPVDEVKDEKHERKEDTRYDFHHDGLLLAFYKQSETCHQRRCGCFGRAHCSCAGLLRLRVTRILNRTILSLHLLRTARWRRIVFRPTVRCGCSLLENNNNQKSFV